VAGAPLLYIAAVNVLMLERPSSFNHEVVRDREYKQMTSNITPGIKKKGRGSNKRDQTTHRYSI